MINELMGDLAIVLEDVEVLDAGGQGDFLCYGLYFGFAQYDPKRRGGRGWDGEELLLPLLTSSSVRS